MPIVNSSIGPQVIIWHSDLANIFGAQIGEGTRIGSFCEIGPCVIGKNCNIQSFCFIPEGIVIGDNVFIGPRVTMLNDKYPPSKGKWRERPGIVIESNAVIGGGVTILPGVIIGAGAFIGAGSLVTKDVMSGSKVMGKI